MSALARAGAEAGGLRVLLVPPRVAEDTCAVPGLLAVPWAAPVVVDETCALRGLSAVKTWPLPGLAALTGDTSILPPFAELAGELPKLLAGVVGPGDVWALPAPVGVPRDMWALPGLDALAGGVPALPVLDTRALPRLDESPGGPLPLPGEDVVLGDMPSPIVTPASSAVTPLLLCLPALDGEICMLPN
jgi:hypothetical protein